MAEGVSAGLALSANAKPLFLPAVVVGGLIVGVLDLSYAIVVYSPGKPILIPQTIASGLLGMKSFSGGSVTATLGVMLHFLIAFGAATAYCLASRKLNFLLSNAVVCGLAYGAFVYVFMHAIVLPLSAAPHRDIPFLYKACEFVWHWFGVGLPIALSARHYSR
jgi:hypothetical protein